MVCKSFIRFICVFVAAVIAVGYGRPDTITGSDSEVTVYHFATDIPDAATTQPDHDVEETTALHLGALLDAGEGAVVTLVAGDTRLAAHKAVLAVRSPVFATTFERIALDANDGQIAVTDMEGPVLRHLLAYMYTLQAPQLPNMAPKLLAAADRYGLPALKTICEQQVAAQLSVETAAATAVLAVRHSSGSLRKAVVTFIRAHFLPVMTTQGWADAMRSHPEDLIQVINLLSQAPAPAETSVPPPANSTTTPTTQPHSSHSNHSQDSASTAPPAATETTSQPDDTVSLQRTAGSGTTADTQPHGSHSRTAAPPAALCPLPPPDDDAVSRLRSLSSEVKDSRLIEAAKEGAVEEVKTLLAAGADVGARDGGSQTALVWAAFNGHLEAAMCLIARGAEVDARINSQYTPLHVAAYNGHTPVVRLLLDSSANPNARNVEGRTPLLLAAYNGHVDVVRMLLASSADPNIRDNDGRMPLHLATYNGHAAVVQLLLASSASPSARDKDGRTPLHLAADNGHTAVVRYLLSSSADCNARDKDGRTPLHWAAYEGHAEVATALLEAGASKDAKDKWGDTPLDDAWQRNYQQLIDILT